jgi:hypothetical protein
MIETTVGTKPETLDPHSEPFIPSDRAPLESISLCMPCVDFCPTQQEIARAIRELGVGTLKRVDIVPVHNTDPHEQMIVNVPKFMVFIHMGAWESTERARKIHARLEAGKTVFLSFDNKLCKCRKYINNS